MNFTHEASRTEYTQEHHDFGNVDRFGRKIGAWIITYEIDFVQAPPESYSGYTIEAGHYFALRVSATRNGESYGASQPSGHFKTINERQIAINKYLASAQKRATKIEFSHTI